MSVSKAKSLDSSIGRFFPIFSTIGMLAVCSYLHKNELICMIRINQDRVRGNEHSRRALCSTRKPLDKRSKKAIEIASRYNW